MITRILLFQQSMVFVDVGKTLYYKLSHEKNASKVVWNNKAYKCLEQVYLPESLIEDCRKLGIECDAYMYQCILLEYSGIMTSRISKLPIEIQQQAFLYAREVLLRIWNESFEKKMSPKWESWNKLIMEKKFKAWKLNRMIWL